MLRFFLGSIFLNSDSELRVRKDEVQKKSSKRQAFNVTDRNRSTLFIADLWAFLNAHLQTVKEDGMI